MGPRLERLKKRSDFLRVAATRKKWATPGLVLQVKRHPADSQTARTGGFLRLGFTASKKVGNAVERNRVKRRLRALAAEILPQAAQSGFDLVIIGRRATLRRSYPKLTGDLLAALRKTGVATDSHPQDGGSQKADTKDAR